MTHDPIDSIDSAVAGPSAAAAAAPSPRALLRQATAAAHADAERAFARFDLARPDGYAGFLAAHARAIEPIERALEAAGIAALLPDWSERSRRAALADDLAALGGAARPAAARPSASIERAAPQGGRDGASLRFALPDAGDEAALLGAAYVLEGSRLGGALLLGRLRAAGDATLLAATRYLAHGAGRPLWPSFLRVLDRSAAVRAQPLRAVRAASAAFAAFRRAAEAAPAAPQAQRNENP